jgi:hypothetical protein
MQQRWSTMERRVVSWFLYIFLSNMDEGPTNSSIWDLASLYRSSNCLDPRDRVFGLLSLADTASVETIRPDYTKSVTEVLLQLIEHRAARDGESQNCLGVMLSGTLMKLSQDLVWARMLQMLQLCYGSGGQAIALTSQVPVWCIETRSGSLGRPAELFWRPTRIAKCRKTKLVNTLFLWWRKDNRRKSLALTSTILLTFRMLYVIVRNPAGAAAALATDLTLPGDILLFFQVSTRRQIPQSMGLVVRKLEGRLHWIVGQFVFDSRYEPCSGDAFAIRGKGSRAASDIGKDVNAETRVGGREDSSPRCHCGGEHELHSLEDWSWKTHFSPEDLLLFVAQDLKLEEHETPGKYIAPMLDLAVYPRERAKRVITGVTSEPLSSYAWCEGEGEDEVREESRRWTKAVHQRFET